MRADSKLVPTSYAALAAVSFAVFLGALDQTVVVTALPSVIEEMRLPFTKLDQASWVVTGYLLGYAAAMPLMGRVSDVYGRRRVLVLALLVFGLASAVCARAGSLNVLVVARAIQAMGGGALVPVAMALVGDAFAHNRRSIVLGAIGAAAEAGGVLGPLYGATVVHLAGWRWIFWLNVPVCALLIGLCLVLLPKTAQRPARIDFLGAIFLGGSLVLLTLVLTQEATAPRPTEQILMLILGFSLLAFLFLWREWRTEQPLVSFPMFKNGTFSAANLTNLLVGGALIMAMVNVPLFATTVLNRSALDSGLLLIRLTALIPVGALTGGVLCRALGYRITTASGLVCSGMGFGLMSRWQATTSDWDMTAGLVLCGLGFGLVIAPVSAAVINSVRQAESGVASALVTVMRMVGMTIGLAALTSWGLARFNYLTATLATPLSQPGETAEQTAERVVVYQEAVLNASLTVYSELFMAAAVLCLLALVPAIALRPTTQVVVDEICQE